jgi:hypothetical protein
VRATGIVVVIAAVVAVGSACSKEAPGAGPKVPSFSTANVPSSAVRDRPVPKSCGAVLTQDEVAEILQVAVTGQTLPIVGVPEPKIGRTARIDCYYGVPTGQDRAAAPVTIGLASYTDETAARKRLDSTVASEKEIGSKAGEVPIGPDRGILLHGKQWTLVAVRGNSTVVITMKLDLVAEDQAGSLIGKLADRALSPR